MKKLTDRISPIAQIRMNIYTYRVRNILGDYHPVDSRDGKKLFEMYLKLMKLEPKMSSKEAIEKHTALCSEILSKLPRIVQ